MGTTPSSSLPTVDDVITPAHRAELTGFCYRMLGSAFDAEDAVQETLTRAWRAYDRFEGRSEVRTWLYRIASNVCFDALRGRQRRALPMEMTGATRAADGLIGSPLPESAFVEPVPGNIVSTHPDDPAEAVAERESIRLAFVAALQHLPPQQRAVLILRDVLKWQASEVAELLGTTVAGVNSALQRAHATMQAKQPAETADAELSDEAQRQLLARYVDAFQRYDIEALTTLIAEDATQSMPPWAMWLRGREEILEWWQGPGAACRDSRLITTEANGTVAFGQYKPHPDGGRAPWALQVIRLEDGEIAEFTFYLDVARMFPLFGLPDTSTEATAEISACRRARALAIDCAVASGIVSRTVVPLPGSLSISTAPPCADTVASTIDNPRPVPPRWRERDGSARKKRSVTLAATSGGHALAAIDRPRATPSSRRARRGSSPGRPAGVHEGVADDVGDHLPQPILVAVDDDWRSAELDVDRPPGRRRAGVGCGVARQQRQVDRSHVERTLLVEPGERQHVIDEAADACRLLLGATHRVVERRRVAQTPDGDTARRSRGSSSPACAARARRRRRSGANAPRMRHARRAIPPACRASC